MNISEMGEHQEYMPELDIRSKADPRSEALGIIERGNFTYRSNVAMACDLAALGFQAVGGKVIPITTDNPQIPLPMGTIRINPLPYAGMLETAPPTVDVSARDSMDPLVYGL